jgi:NAD(P)-dependent dehydrogenase (short-subunit alcohol dehydrogenase family)
MRLKNKVAIITGAATGIGEATALLFAEEGAKVVVADLDPVGGEKTVAQIREIGGQAIFVHTDLRMEADCEKAVDETVKAYGRLDILVNNAAVFVFKGLDSTMEDWQLSLGTNVVGTALLSRFASRQMKKNGGGSIVNLSSMSAFITQREFLCYSSTKAAILHMTRLMAMDLGPSKIRVNSVCPGTILTRVTLTHIAHEGTTLEQFDAVEGGRTMLGRIGQPREVAQAILFLASDEASYITAAHIMVDAGRTSLG